MADRVWWRYAMTVAHLPPGPPCSSGLRTGCALGSNHAFRMFIRIVQRPSGGRVGQPGALKGGGEHAANTVLGDRAVLAADASLEQQWGGFPPGAFVDVVGAHERDRSRSCRVRRIRVESTSASSGLTSIL
jgi:hypothetical protein